MDCSKVNEDEEIFTFPPPPPPSQTGQQENWRGPAVPQPLAPVGGSAGARHGCDTARGQPVSLSRLCSPLHLKLCVRRERVKN